MFATWKINNITNNKKVNVRLNNMQKINNTLASSSESHNGIALSYLIVANTPKNWMSADRIDKSAKSLGVYSLVIKGVPIKIISCASKDVKDNVIVDL